MQLEEEMPDPTVLVMLRKRLRSSKFITLRTQSSKRDVKKLQIDKSLKSNVRELLAEETDKHNRGHRLIISPERDTRTLHVRYKRNITLKSAEKRLSRVQITTGQTNQKAILKRVRFSFK